MTTPGLGPKALDTAILRIRTARDEPAGVGFLVTPVLALTCAHVVAAALGPPGDRIAGARVRVELPLPPAKAEGVEASVEHWAPAEDVAVLRLATPLPDGRPVRLVEPGDVWAHPARAFGFPAGRDGGVWHSGLLRSRQADGWVQLDLAGTGYGVSGGFSGGPVWDEQLVGVVGMMAVAEATSPPVSYLIPTDGLLAAWPPLREMVLPPSPFRGLSVFQEADAEVFFGRDEESGELAAQVAAEPRLCLVGPSGSGKSSLALAGVIPRLRERGWTAAVVRPGSGSEPLMALAAALLPLIEPDADALTRLRRARELRDVLAAGGLADVVSLVLERAGAGRLLIVLDQYEELVALGPDAAASLTGVLFTDRPPDRMHTLATLRADFVETTLADPRFGAALRGGIYALRPMSPEGLRRVVTAPVAAIPGVAYEQGLADRILTDAGDAPGALPLLGFTLDLLWRQQSGGLLTHAAYTDLGGVTGALSAHADQVWTEYVPQDDEPAAGRLLGRLIRLPIGSAAATRRAATRAELDEEESAIAERLAGTRLLVTGGQTEGEWTVELAHDALITGWSRLSTWVAGNLTFLAWREALSIDLDRWERADRAPDLLPTATGLAAADRWLRERPEELTDAQREYLELGRRQHRSRVLRRRGLWSVLSVLTVLALVLGSLFAYQRRVSAERDALATSRALVEASAEERQDPVRSVMLALAAYRASPTDEARNALLKAYLTYAGSERDLSGLVGRIGEVQASRDGDVVLANAMQGGATLFTHAADGRVHERTLPSDAQVFRPVVSADGRRVGVVNIDGTAEWYEVRDADRATLSGPHRVAGARAEPENSFAANQAAMSPDGKVIAWWSAGHLVWRDLDTGAQGSAASPRGSDGTVWFGPDDRTVLTTVLSSAKTNKLTAVAVNLVTGKSRTVVTGVNSWLVSGDGTVVDYCRNQGDRSVTAALRVADSAAVGRAYRAPDPCGLSAVDLTGHRVVGGSTSLSLIDLDAGRSISTTTAIKDTYNIWAHLASNHGRLLVIGSADTRITFTEVPTTPKQAPVIQSALTPDGDRTVSELADGTRLQLRLAEDGGRVLAEAARDTPVWKSDVADLLRSDRSGTLVADREGANLVSIRDLPSLREQARITTAAPPPVTGDPAGNFSYSFADAGLITQSGTRIEEWNPRTGRRLAAFDASVFHPRIDQQGRFHYAVTRYPGPHQVAVLVEGDPLVHLVNLRTGRVTAGPRIPADAIAVQFDRSGHYFAVLRHGSILELWRRHPLGRELGPFPSVDAPPWVGKFIDEKGRFLLAANGVIRIYRIGDHTYQDYNPGPADEAGGIDYKFLDASADGRTVLVVDADGAGRPLVLDPRVWRRDLCRIIGYRDFTPAERSASLVRIPAGPVCG